MPPEHENRWVSGCSGRFWIPWERAAELRKRGVVGVGAAGAPWTPSWSRGSSPVSMSGGCVFRCLNVVLATPFFADC